MLRTALGVRRKRRAQNDKGSAVRGGTETGAMGAAVSRMAGRTRGLILQPIQPHGSNHSPPQLSGEVKVKSALSPERLAQLLLYEPETGKLYWQPRVQNDFLGHSDVLCRQFNTRRAGKEAFAASHPEGYLQGEALGRRALAHRVVWALCNRVWPEGEIDHINGDRSDNRIANLRCVTHGENQRNRRQAKNNTSGRTGVQWSKQAGRWQAAITLAGRQRVIGQFRNKQDAVMARERAERELGFHPNHGLPRLSQ